MKSGTYGITKPAFINSNDIDIFYQYRSSYSTDDVDGFVQMSESDVKTIFNDVKVGDTETIPGLYNLKLPVNLFNKSGIYTLYIKPKEIETTILDVSTLAAYPSVRGVVLDITKIVSSDSTIFNNNGLVGYRIEYFNDDKERIDMSRLITSSNRCEPVAQNLNDSSAKGIKYRFNDASNLLFCTVTPSTSMSFKSNSLPNIGTSLQTIRLVNTKFNPICIELEMVEHDTEDIATMLEGEQLRNLNSGLITTFNKDGEIYHQAHYGHVVNNTTGMNSDFKVNNDSTTIINGEKDNMNKIKEQLG